MSEQSLRKGSGVEIDKSPVNIYYQMKEPKTPHKKVKVLKKGQEIIGSYEHTFKDTKYDPDNPPQTHLFKTEKEGKVTIQGCKLLNEQVAQLKRGDLVRVVYSGQGVSKIKSRKPPFLFDVYLLPSKPQVKVIDKIVDAAELDEDTTDDTENDPF